ncbi:hypothetical protein WJX74_000691 [Apatococcus lobatus]|uniref:Uncharacterized protein n=2 Tax=Apatococcus TaxID=904362 RepID=A0AAW1SPC4_9CHLO
MKVSIERWQDGQKVRKELDGLDRWEVHAAHSLWVEAAGCKLKLQQEPHALAASRVGVGACAWDSAFMLLAYFEQQDTSKWRSCRVVELGAGIGLLGTVLAQLGAQVVLTDQASVMPLLTSNVAANDMKGQAGSVHLPWRAQAMQLDWDLPQDREGVLAAVGGHVDLILAADCCYVDEGGRSANAATIIHMCSALSTSPCTRSLVAFEKRSEALLRDLEEAAHSHFLVVKELELQAAFVGSSAWASDHIVVLALEESKQHACGVMTFLAAAMLDERTASGIHGERLYVGQR